MALPNQSNCVAPGDPSDDDYNRIVDVAENLVPVTSTEAALTTNNLSISGFDPAATGGLVQVPSGSETYTESLNPLTFDQNYTWDIPFLPLNQISIWPHSSEQPVVTSSSTSHNGAKAQEGSPPVAVSGTDASENGIWDRYGKRCIQPLISRTCPSFPSLQPKDDMMILVEDFSHVSEISNPAYNQIVAFFMAQSLSEGKSFPEANVIYTFVQLYYEYFDAEYPFIHPVLLEFGDDSWILLLAVAAVGSHYSSISNVEEYSRGLQSLLHRAVETNVSRSSVIEQKRKIIDLC
nr:uncharacterized protein CTRU02_11184 [Colletotrichum truncatum]KAF6786313.1 hypothetical protein CTRU02_11184 [Colletotrichum truncatum]